MKNNRPHDNNDDGESLKDKKWSVDTKIYFQFIVFYAWLMTGYITKGSLTYNMSLWAVSVIIKRSI